MSVRVSVVVAVYNPGPYLEGLIDSLARQTMPAGAWEAIFVDDGSTDDTGARLDRLAADNPHIQAIHIPNSGWAGRPRNVGIDAASGTYVYIVDHDDWLGAEALERIYERAERTRADVLVPKEVGHGFGVPLVAFQHNVDDASLGEHPLQALLTPHKLFRRSMLVEHAIRFPEGRRRLEDHLFVMHAYFHARRIAILADYPCYHWTLRRDRSNATHSRVDWNGYFANVREILDVVDEHVEPGSLRDTLYGHWYRNKTLHKLRGRRWYEPPLSAGSHDLFAAAGRITEERFDPRLDRDLPVRYRVLASATRTGRLDLVAAHAAFTDGIAATAEPLSVEARDGEIDLAMRCAIIGPDGAPLRFARRGGRLVWLPPEEIAAHDGLLGPEVLDANEELPASTATALLRHRGSRTEYSASVALPLEERDGIVAAAGTARFWLDLSTFAGGGPLSDGTWDLLVQLEIAGWRATHKPVGIELEAVPQSWAARPYVNQDGGLSITVRGSAGVVLESPPHIDAPPAARRPALPPPTSPVRRMLRRVVPMPARRAARALAHRLTR